MSKFTASKTIPELAAIAKSVKVTGAERLEEQSPHANYCFMVTVATSYGEVTRKMFSDSRLPDFRVNLIDMWTESIKRCSLIDGLDNVSSFFSPLFGEAIYYDDMLDILEYCNISN